MRFYYLFVVLGIIVSSGLTISAFAQEQDTFTTNQTSKTFDETAAAPKQEILRMTGELDMISDKQILVKDDEGISISFPLNENVTIYNKNGKKTSATWISRGVQVRVTYSINPDGIKKNVQSVNILPDEEKTSGHLFN